MTTVLDIEHQLDGEVIIRDHYVGDIRCKKLTITRTGSVKGNILCKHLQVGGYVEGIAVCHALEGNTQGTLHGSLYYVTKKDEAKVAGIVDYRQPPFSVWAVVMPETIDIPPFFPTKEVDVVVEDIFADAADEVVQAVVSDADSTVFVDVAEIADEALTPRSDLGDEIGFAPALSSLPVEVSDTSSKFFPTPVEIVEELQKSVDVAPSVAWVSTGRKVPLNARFF